MKIKENILNILGNCRVEDNVVFLPPEQLDRKTYQEVNKCLVSIGGKWNRKAKGHVFSEDPAELFDNLILTGEVADIRKQFQYFPTPPKIAQEMIGFAELRNNHSVLEPSAGQGAIADEIIEAFPGVKLTLVELNSQNAKILQTKGYQVYEGDFLKFSGKFDRIIMNPPFTKQQDIDHILHAFELLNGGGILVSIVSESPFFRDNRKSVEFRCFLQQQEADIFKNTEGAFKASGTMVRTRMIKIVKS